MKFALGALCGAVLSVGVYLFVGSYPDANPLVVIAIVLLILCVGKALSDRINDRPVYEDELEHTCGACGKPLQAVRPGKYQCVNPRCPSIKAHPLRHSYGNMNICS
jgi:hypothetical protein